VNINANKKTIRKGSRKPSASGSKYVVRGRFDMMSDKMSEDKAKKLVKKVRSRGGTATMKKV
jgi:hypothetical protein